MSKPKRTPWYPPEIKPVRKGHYECERCVLYGKKFPYHFWNGKSWAWGSTGETLGLWFSWRGLTERAK